MKTLALTAITFLLLASGAKAQFLKAYDAKEAAKDVPVYRGIRASILGTPAEQAARKKADLEAYKLELLILQTQAAIRAAELAELQNRRIEQEAFLKGKIIIPR